MLRRQTGIDRGFDFFDDALEVAGTGESLSDTQRDGRATADALAAWTDAHAGQPIFAFLHLYEPHTPYAPPTAYASAQPYDGEISYADELVGRFLQRLETAGILKRAIVAVVSDHGEGLGDHGEAEHGVFLYREALHVPWILRLPGDERGGTRVEGTAGLVDVAPTLLELTGLGVDGVDGGSVLAARRRPARRPHRLFRNPLSAHSFRLERSCVRGRGRYHFIRAPSPELYDVGARSGERNNLISRGRRPPPHSPPRWRRQPQASHPLNRKLFPKTSAAAEIARVRRFYEVTMSASNANLTDPKDGIASFETFKKALACRTCGANR